MFSKVRNTSISYLLGCSFRMQPLCGKWNYFDHLISKQVAQKDVPIALMAAPHLVEQPKVWGNEPAFPPLSSWESKGAPPPKKLQYLTFSTQEIHSLQPSHHGGSCGLLGGGSPMGEDATEASPYWVIFEGTWQPTDRGAMGSRDGWSALDVNRRWDVGWLWTTEREGGCCWPLLGFLGASFSGMMSWYLLEIWNKILFKAQIPIRKWYVMIYR